MDSPQVPVLPPEQSAVILRASFLSLASSLYAISLGHYDFAFVVGGVFVTSVLYWWHPDYSWRRYIDMAMVKSGIAYQVYRAQSSPRAITYYIILGGGIWFYFLGCHYYKRKKLWHSTYSHTMLHILGNISNIILYSSFYGAAGAAAGAAE